MRSDSFYTSGLFTRYQKKWNDVRKLWIALNPPNHQGYYECFYCHTWVAQAAITLDHKHSRSRHPELRFDLSNLVPACWNCNQKKGSRSLEEMIERICMRCHKRIKPDHKPAQRKLYCQCTKDLPF